MQKIHSPKSDTNVQLEESSITLSDVSLTLSNANIEISSSDSLSCKAQIIIVFSSSSSLINYSTFMCITS